MENEVKLNKITIVRKNGNEKEIKTIEIKRLRSMEIHYKILNVKNDGK